MTLHPTDPLPAAFRAMGAAGILLYFGGVGIGVCRSSATIARERFTAVGVIIVLMGIGRDINGVVLLVGIDLILLASSHGNMRQPVGAGAVS